VNLLERAFRLRRPVRGRLHDGGRGASARCRGADERGGDACAELLARLVHQPVLSYTSPESFTRVGQLAEQAIPVFEAAGDDRGLMGERGRLSTLTAELGHVLL
jgi:hypothetical protein